MTLEKTKPGESWRPPKSADHNATARMVDQWQQGGELETPPSRYPITRTSDVIKVENLTGSDRKLGDVVEVGESLLSDTNRLNLAFEGNTPNDGHRYAILREPAAIDAVVNAQIGGICEARVNITDATHLGASPFKGLTILQSSDCGPYRLWWAPDGATGEQDCLIMIDPPAGSVIAKTPTGGIPGRSGTTVGSVACELYTLGSDDLLVPMTNSSAVAITKPVKNLFIAQTAGDAYIVASVETSGNLILISEDCPQTV